MPGQRERIASRRACKEPIGRGRPVAIGDAAAAAGRPSQGTPHEAAPVNSWLPNKRTALHNIVWFALYSPLIRLLFASQDRLNSFSRLWRSEGA